MTPAARVQTAIELLDAIISAAQDEGAPADRILSEWFRTHRFAGSKDRHAIRELVYRAIRACGPVPESGRVAMLRLAADESALRALFDGSQYGPVPIREDEVPAEAGIAPLWLEERLAASSIKGAAAVALLRRAPLDIRVNALKTRRSALELPETGETLPVPHGLRFPPGTRIEQWPAFHAGLIEVQDCGSQLACEAVGARPGETVIDLCAGAGGKTLALAASMENLGTLIAADTDRGRLSRLGPRAERAGAKVAETLLLDPGREREALEHWLGRADRVLVDAPCSGTGTWRRNPEARWRLSEASLARLTALQARLLDLAGELLRPGGMLTYVVCSLLDEEGVDQIRGFLDRTAETGAGSHAGAGREYRIVPLEYSLGEPRGGGMRLTPGRSSTDGFFIARLEQAW